jgi:hypothetical protein
LELTWQMAAMCLAFIPCLGNRAQAQYPHPP